MSSILKNNPDNKKTLDAEIDLKQIFLILISKKKIISYFAFSGFILGCIIAIFTERVWKGEFQIVLSQDNKSSSSNQLLQSLENSNLGGLIGNNSIFDNNTSNNLKTEIEILKSPSVLMDIFEFVKEKKSPNSNKNDEFRFKDWKKSLEITSKKGTTILDISYKDKDKKLIEEVLSKLSLKYQSYAGEKRLKQIKLGIKYLKEQIDLYSKRSIESFKKVQQFVFDQDLYILLDQNAQLYNASDVELLRVKSLNELKFLNEIISNLKKSKIDESNLIPQALALEEFRNTNEENIASKLIQLENNLLRLRTVYNEQDKAIQTNLKKRDYLLKGLKKQLIGIYESRKLNTQAKLAATKRSKDVLIKYSYLLSESLKDRKILESLDNQYRALLIDQARNLEPWNLITKPSLLPNPVGTPRKLIAFVGLIGGLTIGLITALFYGLFKENKISSSEEIDLLVEYPIISELSIRNFENWTEDFELIKSSIVFNTKGSLGILIINETNSLFIDSFNNFLKKSLEDRKKIITKNIIEILDYDNIIILSTLNVSSRKSFIDVNKKLKIQNKYVFGSIVIKD